jgi:hypothetical protein
VYYTASVLGQIRVHSTKMRMYSCKTRMYSAETSNVFGECTEPSKIGAFQGLPKVLGAFSIAGCGVGTIPSETCGVPWILGLGSHIQAPGRLRVKGARTLPDQLLRANTANPPQVRASQYARVHGGVQRAAPPLRGEGDGAQYPMALLVV